MISWGSRRGPRPVDRKVELPTAVVGVMLMVISSGSRTVERGRSHTPICGGGGGVEEADDDNDDDEDDEEFVGSGEVEPALNHRALDRNIPLTGRSASL